MKENLALKWIRNFFKLPKVPSNTEVLFFRVKCLGCSEVIKVRVNMLTDLESMYAGGHQEDVAFKLRKEILGKNCQKLMMLEADFDRNKKVISVRVEGGRLLCEEKPTGS